MPLINQPTDITLGDIAANPYFDWANAMHINTQLTIDGNKLTSISNGFGGVDVDGLGLNPVQFPANRVLELGDINTLAPWESNVIWYPSIFLKVDGATHPKGSLAIVKQSVQVLEITGPSSGYSGMVWIATDAGAGGAEAEGLHRGFGLIENGYWESNTPSLTSVDIVASFADQTPTGDYYMGIGITKWDTDDYSFARIAYNATLAPYIAA